MSVQLIKGTSENGGKQLAIRFDPAEDLPKIVLKGEPRAAYGSIFANVVYEGKAPTILLPPMVVAFDPSSYQDSKKVTVDLSFREATTHSSVLEAYQAFRALDDRMCSLLVQAREKLLPTVKKSGPLAKTDQEIRSYYQACTRPRTSAKSDRAWPARLSCTLTGAKIVGGEGDNQSVAKGDVVRCLVQVTTLCSRQEKVSLGFRIVQLRKISDGLPYPDISLSEEEAFGVSLKEDSAAESSAMQIEQEFV